MATFEKMGNRLFLTDAEASVYSQRLAYLRTCIAEKQKILRRTTNIRFTFAKFS